MFDFHQDKSVYFSYQYRTSLEYIIPFVKQYKDLSKPLKVLEIGSAEAGVLKAFTEQGHECVGIELSPSRVELASKFMAEELAAGKVKFIAKDIFDIDIKKDIGHKFDLIILKDVIEHIHDQEKFMTKIGDFLNPEGVIFFGFPPWMMPFGGHQQISRSKVLSKMPYFHLLPMPVYKGVLKLFGDKPNRIDDLVEIKQTGISIERFDRILKNTNFNTLMRKFYLTNPIYQYKFNLPVKEQIKLVSSLPIIRNYFTTCVYYIVDQVDHSTNEES